MAGHVRFAFVHVRVVNCRELQLGFASSKLDEAADFLSRTGRLDSVDNSLRRISAMRRVLWCAVHRLLDWFKSPPALRRQSPLWSTA